MTDHRIFVTPATVRFQGVELPSGQIAAVEMESPSHGFAVLHQIGDAVEILSLHQTEAEAVDRCKEIGSLLDDIGGKIDVGAVHPGGETLQ